MYLPSRRVLQNSSEACLVLKELKILHPILIFGSEKLSNLVGNNLCLFDKNNGHTSHFAIPAFFFEFLYSFHQFLPSVP